MWKILVVSSNATEFNSPLESWDVSANSFAYMFAYAEKFNQKIDTWETTRVTDFNHVFRNKFNRQIRSWDLSSVDLSYFFAGSNLIRIFGWN